MNRPVLHLPSHHDRELEQRLIEARARLVKAKAKWTRVTVDVLKRVPHAGAGVAAALAELDELNKAAIEGNA